MSSLFSGGGVNQNHKYEVEDAIYFLQDTIGKDTTKQSADTVIEETEKDKKPLRHSSYEQRDRYGNPFADKQSSSSLFLKDPSGLKLDIEIDTALNYTIYEKLGEVNYRPTSSMTFEEFSKYQERQILKDYWKSRAIGLDGESAVSGRSLIPPLYISPVFDKIFGGSRVDLVPTGFVTLDFGSRFSRNFNQSLPKRRQRSITPLELDQQITMNVVGSIGDKLRITTNFDNNNSFNFENNFKVEYTGYEEDIIKKIELGNVSLPLNNSLISGSQNLFGVKTQLQFGKLFVTAVATSQKGKSDVLTVNGGSNGGQAREFEIRGSNYDENRHFFLGQFFRDHYEEWLSNSPRIIGGVSNLVVEVYITNNTRKTENLRNIAGFMDLGEGDKAYNKVDIGAFKPGSPTTNDANDLFIKIKPEKFRNPDEIKGFLRDEFHFEDATDFEVLNSAVKLDEREYTINQELGYISLFRQLRSEEVLAVSYSYNYQGKRYQVGELSFDYGHRQDDDVIFLKLLKRSKVNPKDKGEKVIPIWDLMMKNIYNLNANQITRDNFQLRIVYKDPIQTIDNPSLNEGLKTKDVPLIQLVNLDVLNQNNDQQPDGNFDYIEGITINPDRGNIIFPVLEPFGSNMAKYFEGDPEENTLITRYVYDVLYNATKNDAEQATLLNNYYITGSLQAGSSSEIRLQGINITPGSVKVFAGGTPLVEGQAYRVDYTFGTVTILDESILNSGRDIRIEYEKSDAFGFDTKTLVGARLDYQYSDNFNIGATVLHLNERPLYTRLRIGDEPSKNTKYGFDINYKSDSRFLTKLVDAIPLIQTKEKSSITFSGEFAQFLPGTSNIVAGSGTAYIDDFEQAVIPSSLAGFLGWKLGSTPRTDDNSFGYANDDLSFGYKRAKIAWYSIDRVLLEARNRPDNISKEDIENHYVREVSATEVFPKLQQEFNQALNIFNIAYFPEERGQYNYNPNLTVEGKLKNPKSNWGGISRTITTEVDFDKANIEYIEFWLLDPFIGGKNGEVINGINNDTGGKLVFNLGSISEDVIKDGKHGFENGLPAEGTATETEVATTPWGRVTKQQFLIDAFENSTEAKTNQDIGLDGLSNEIERTHFVDFLNDPSMPASARLIVSEDPSADDFEDYLGAEQDAQGLSILQRYMGVNGMEGNSPTVTGSANQSASGTTRPDNEDLNRDNTLATLEEFYEYEVELNPNEMEIGKNYIVGKTTSDVRGEQIDWYQFRIPIRQPDKIVGNISDFKTIRFMRTYLHDFSQPVVLRFAEMQMVGSQWRKVTNGLEEGGIEEIEEPADNTIFNVSVVNLEENSQGGNGSAPYVLPPGIERDRNIGSLNATEQNEQSLMLTVKNLEDKDARAVFKQENVDLINYGRIKMFFHAEDPITGDGELTAFLRIGKDEQNYYEMEIPLVITPQDVTAGDARAIWPEANEIDVAFNDLTGLKVKRNRTGSNLSFRFSSITGPLEVGQTRLTIRGNPDLATTQLLTIGIRNPVTPDKAPKSVVIWVNELRVTDFDSKAGWAANARLNLQLADFANITASTRYTSVGFGSLQDKIAQRSRDEITQFDVTAQVKLDKFLPEKAGISLPMYVSYESRNIKPFYDPLDDDIPLDVKLDNLPVNERAEYKSIVIDKTIGKSINFTNVKKVKVNTEAKNRIYDLSNFAFTYAYREETRHSFKLAEYIFKSYKGAVAYNFAPPEKSIEPFKNAKFLKSPYLKLIKDFNISFMPSNISVRFDLDRRFVKSQYRNSDRSVSSILPTYEKYFTFNRFYDVRWNLTKGLTFDYTAKANAIIDEPLGEIDTEQNKTEVWKNIQNLGRMKSFDQDVAINYRLPLDKFPMTDWIRGDVRYSAGYTWTSGSKEQIEEFGNIIENNRQKNLTSKFDLVKLYNKVKILKEINTPKRKTRKKTPVKAKKEGEGEEEEEEKVRANKGVKGFLRLLMSVRSVDFTYNVSEGTYLPGYKRGNYLFGLDSAFSAPGLGFVLGSQNPNVKERVAQYLVDNDDFNIPFKQNNNIDLTINAIVEPLKDFRITLKARKKKSNNYQEIFRNTGSLSPSRGGAYGISYLALKTMFNKDNADNTSPVFKDFERYRQIIHDRLVAKKAELSTLELNSQEVLIPAFIAAYTGKSPNEVKLSPFPKIPIPNWSVSYTGLSKIPKLKKIFRSITINHSYNSSYDVRNYTSNAFYDGADVAVISLDNNIEDYPLPSKANDIGIFVPVFTINQVSLIESFSPLIGFNISTKKRMNFNIDYNRERSLTLNMSNSQITELTRGEFSLTFGYTKAKFKLPFRRQGKVITLKNDLSIKMQLSIGDNKTVQRKIDDLNTITSGTRSFQLRPTIDYIVNEKVSVQIYFERSVNDPRVLTAFKRTSTAFGTRIRFSLSQ